MATVSAPAREDLVGAVVVHARPDLLLHPHAAAAGAAAEAVLLVARQLDPAGRARRQRVQHVARGVVLAVPAAEVAGVVEGDLRHGAAATLPNRCRRRRRQLVAVDARSCPPRPARGSAGCGGGPRSCRPSCGYSFLIVCRQCGQAVTTFFTFLRVHRLDVLLRLHLVQHLVAGRGAPDRRCSLPRGRAPRSRRRPRASRRPARASAS